MRIPFLQNDFLFLPHQYQRITILNIISIPSKAYGKSTGLLINNIAKKRHVKFARNSV